jgi:hypothetical protein
MIPKTHSAGITASAGTKLRHYITRPLWGNLPERGDSRPFFSVRGSPFRVSLALRYLIWPIFRTAAAIAEGYFPSENWLFLAFLHFSRNFYTGERRNLFRRTNSNSRWVVLPNSIGAQRLHVSDTPFAYRQSYSQAHYFPTLLS